MEIALTAAETGHLVFSTLHTVDAAHTLNRIMGMFPLEEERQVRTRLAGALRWIVCQRLLPRQDIQGRYAVFEVLMTSLRIQDLILNGESEGKSFYEVIEASPWLWQARRLTRILSPPTGKGSSAKKRPFFTPPGARS